MRSHIKTFLLLAIVVAILIWFGRKLDWAQVWTAVGQMNKSLLALAVLCICSTYLIRAFRWRVFLKPLASVGIKELFAATTVGFSAVFIIGRAGELMRPAFLSLRNRSVPPTVSFITIAVERIFDSAAMILLFAIALLMVKAPTGVDAGVFARIRSAGFLLLAGATFGIACLVLFRRYAAQVINWIEARLPAGEGFANRVGRGIVHVARQLDAALGVLTNARALASAIGWSVLLWTIITIASVLVLRAFGLQLGIAEAVFVMGCSMVGSLVPTPGGAAGAYEAATMGGLFLLGVGREQAFAAAIVLKFVMFTPAIFFGLYYFMTSGVRLSRLRAAAQQTEDAGVDEDETSSRDTEKPIEPRVMHEAIP